MGSLSGLLSQICCTLVVLSQNYDMRQVLFLKPEISSIKKYMRSRIFVNIISDNNIWSIHCYTTLPCKQNHKWKSESHFTYTLLMMRNPHLLSYCATYTSPVHRALVCHVIKLNLFFHCPEQQPWLSKFLVIKRLHRVWLLREEISGQVNWLVGFVLRPIDSKVI